MTGSTCRATTAAGCSGTRSSRPGTWAAPASALRSSATQAATTSCSRSTRAGRSRGWRSAVPRRAGHWIAIVRAALVAVAVVDVWFTHFRARYEPWAWLVVGFFGASAVFSAWLTRVELGRTARVRARALSIALDAATVLGFLAVFSYQAGQPYRALYLLPIVEAALRFGLLGGVVGAVVMEVGVFAIDELGPG